MFCLVGYPVDPIASNALNSHPRKSNQYNGITPPAVGEYYPLQQANTLTQTNWTSSSTLIYTRSMKPAQLNCRMFTIVYIFNLLELGLAGIEV